MSGLRAPLGLKGRRWLNRYVVDPPEPRGSRASDAFRITLISLASRKGFKLLWDDALAGFGVAAFASGKKVYVAQYRQARRSRRITIGEHGRLTPDEARRQT